MGTEEGNTISPIKERLIKDYKTALEMTRELYEDEGWVVDTSEIENDFGINLEEKTKILELGWGVKLTSDCGCEWKVDKENGDWERLRECGIEDCEGLPNFPKEKKIIKKAPAVEKKQAPKKAPFCGDHPGEKMVRDPKGKFWICPQHKGE